VYAARLYGTRRVDLLWTDESIRIQETNAQRQLRDHILCPTRIYIMLIDCQYFNHPRTSCFDMGFTSLSLGENFSICVLPSVGMRKIASLGLMVQRDRTCWNPWKTLRRRRA
jgi:hypothetical protein